MVTKVTSLQPNSFHLLIFVILLTSFTRSKPFSPHRKASRRSAERRVPGVHCMASARLPVIRAESAHQAHQKCLFVFGSRFRHRPRNTDGLVQQSPRDAFLRWNQKSSAHRVV